MLKPPPDNDDIFEQAKLAGLNPLVAHNGCDWSNRDLRNIQLIGPQLNGSNLSRSKLKGAKLPDAQLCGADLTEAKLCGAQLPDANLQGADLRRSDLNGADLRRADLTNAKLSGANVQGTNFEGCIGLTDDTKRNLKKRGAIFKDSVAEGNFIAEENNRWLVRYVIVPLIVAFIGSGGIVTIITIAKNKHSSPSRPVPIDKPVDQGTSSPKPMPTTKAMTPRDSLLYSTATGFKFLA